MNLKVNAKAIKKSLPAIYLSLKDSRTPWLAKLLAIITIAYALSPIDLIPDFIPILGYLDDLIILPLLIALTLKIIPKDIYNKHIEEAKGLWKYSKPKKWYYSIPIILLWLLFIYLILKILFN